MFEAIHGSAPRMIAEGRGMYADPLSLMRASALMLEHIGMLGKSQMLSKALDICSLYERKVKVTGRPGGASTTEFGDYVTATLNGPRLNARWRSFQVI
jgi:isocitrate dehydrogenase (NAD+)